MRQIPLILAQQPDDEIPKNAKKNPEDIAEDSDFLMWCGILVCTLIVGGILFSWLDKWRKRQMTEENPLDRVTSYREMLESGELSQEEYDRIMKKVSDQAKGNKITAKPKQTAPASQSPPQDPTKPS